MHLWNLPIVMSQMTPQYLSQVSEVDELGVHTSLWLSKHAEGRTRHQF